MEDKGTVKERYWKLPGTNILKGYLRLPKKMHNEIGLIGVAYGKNDLNRLLVTLTGINYLTLYFDFLSRE